MPHDDDADDALDGEEALHDVTDDEWRAAHEKLRDLGVFPDDELAYTWQPNIPGHRLDSRRQMTYVDDDEPGTADG